MSPNGRPAGRALAESRAQIQRYAVAPDPEVGRTEPVDADGVHVVTIVPTGAREDVALLHFHGGAYRRGSPEVEAAQLARIAKDTGGAVVHAVGYRLAPENPAPAAVDDAICAYRWLRRSVPADRIVVTGDSAGAGVAAALLLRIRAEGLEEPAGAVLMSPWADLRVSAASYAENDDTDLLFSTSAATVAAEEYLAGQDPNDPTISAALADWTGQPPLLVLVSDIEVLRDDSLLLASAAKRAGVRVRLERFPAAQHVWPMMDYPRTDDSKRAVDLIREFLAEVLPPVS